MKLLLPLERGEILQEGIEENPPQIVAGFCIFLPFVAKEDDELYHDS